MLNKLKSEMKYVVNKYGLNSIKTYNVCVRLSIEKDSIFNKNTVQSYYNYSLEMLIKYIENNEKNPNEVTWNKYALENKILSAESMGYIYGNGFNKLCKEIRTEINSINNKNRR